MPSRACADLNERLREIDQLLEAHGALTRLKRAEAALAASTQSLQNVAQVVNALVTPPGVGRPAEVQALNKAAIALLSAHLQGYVEDVFEEVGRVLLHGRVPQIDALLTQAQRRGNPNWDNITRLFAAIGFADILNAISWRGVSNATLKKRLRELNELRNRIVHGQTETVRKRVVVKYSSFVRQFAARLDRTVAQVYAALTGQAPW